MAISQLIAIDYTQAPTAPTFNADDSSSCMSLINSFYDDATSAFNTSQENNATFDALYAKILTNKALNSVKFVGEDSLDGNASFRDWVLGQDWYDVWDPDTDVPEFDETMEAMFGANGEEVTTANQLQTASWHLVFYREGYNLEDLIFNDEPYYPVDTFDECSVSTQSTGIIYAMYLSNYCCDNRVENLLPFLESLDQWVSDQAN